MAENSQENSRSRRARAEHLRPFDFKPGQSGNPAGRPKNAYSDAHKLIASGSVKDLRIRPTDTVALAIAKIVCREALKGKIDAAKEAADRTEGRSPQRHEVSGPDQAAIQVEAKLSTGDLLGAIAHIYGLSTEKPAA
jgi:Family of unknown function (DUF5681)